MVLLNNLYSKACRVWNIMNRKTRANQVILFHNTHINVFIETCDGPEGVPLRFPLRNWYNEYRLLMTPGFSFESAIVLCQFLTISLPILILMTSEHGKAIAVFFPVDQDLLTCTFDFGTSTGLAEIFSCLLNSSFFSSFTGSHHELISGIWPYLFLILSCLFYHQQKVPSRNH